MTYNPGYGTEYDVARLKTNLYDVATEKLIWSAASETIDPLSLAEVVNSLTKQLVDRLSESGLI